MCCGRSSLDVEPAVRHPELPNVLVCHDCFGRKPSGVELGLQAWVIDEGDWVVAASLEEALAWYDEKHGVCKWEEGRSVEPLPLDTPVHVDETPTSPTVPFRQFITDHIRRGGKFPAVLAHDLNVL